MIKKLLVFLLIPFLASGQTVVSTGNHRKIFTGVTASPCGSSITSVTGDYWAGSYSSSPITTNWTDSSSFANAMIPTGSPTWGATTFGSGLAGVTLNGSSQWFAAATKQYPATSFSNFAAYGVVVMASGGGGSFTGNHGSNSTLVFKISQGTPGSMALDKQNLLNLCTSAQTFTAGTIYEVGVTYDGTTCKFYINGSNVFTGTGSASGLVGMDIFLVQGTANNNPFHGSVYEFIFSSSSTFQSGAHTCWTGFGLP